MPRMATLFAFASFGGDSRPMHLSAPTLRACEFDKRTLEEL
jgi:hypothetical protein